MVKRSPFFYTYDEYIRLSVDPLAEKYPNMSSYVYCLDNPVMFVDPDGERIKFAESQSKEFKIFVRTQLILGSLVSSSFRHDVLRAVFSRRIFFFQEQIKNNLQESGNETHAGSVDLDNWEKFNPHPVATGPFGSLTNEDFERALEAIEKHKKERPRTHENGIGSDVIINLHTPEMKTLIKFYSNVVQIAHELFHGLRIANGRSLKDINLAEEERDAIIRQNQVAKQQNIFLFLFGKNLNKMRDIDYSKPIPRK